MKGTQVSRFVWCWLRGVGGWRMDACCGGRMAVWWWWGVAGWQGVQGELVGEVLVGGMRARDG